MTAPNDTRSQMAVNPFPPLDLTPRQQCYLVCRIEANIVDLYRRDGHLFDAEEEDNYLRRLETLRAGLRSGERDLVAGAQ